MWLQLLEGKSVPHAVVDHVQIRLLQKWGNHQCDIWLPPGLRVYDLCATEIALEHWKSQMVTVATKQSDKCCKRAWLFGKKYLPKSTIGVYITENSGSWQLCQCIINWWHWMGLPQNTLILWLLSEVDTDSDCFWLFFELFGTSIISAHQGVGSWTWEIIPVITCQPIRKQQ